MESVNSDNLYYMKQAFKEAEKSKCPRTKVGCILIKDSNILAVAHNSEVLDLDRCSKNGCIRIANGVPSGLNVEICRGIHAEQKIDYYLFAMWDKSIRWNCLYYAFSVLYMCKDAFRGRHSRIILFYRLFGHRF